MADYELRNATYNRWGTIDVEWNHPQFGWIPFTANPEDPEAHGREIFEQIKAAGNIADYVPPPEPTPEMKLMMMSPEARIEARLADLEARLAALEEEK